MENSGFNVTREGLLFKIGEDVFRLKITRGDEELNVEDKEVDEIAGDVFEMLKSTQESYKSLKEVSITSTGIKTHNSFFATDEKGYSEKYEKISNKCLDVLSKQQIGLESEEKISVTFKESEDSISIVQNKIKDVGIQIKKRSWIDKIPEPLIKIGEFFEKLFPAGRKNFKKRHKNIAEQLVSKATEKKELFSSGVNIEKSENKLDVMKIDEKILMSSEEEQLKLRSSKIGAKTAVKRDNPLHKSVPFMNWNNVEIRGCEVEESKGEKSKFGGKILKVKEGSIVPTAYRHANTTEAKESEMRLMNIYLTKTTDNKRGVIRTGVIDTPEKAEEFLVAAKTLNEKIGGKSPSQFKPLRIASNQLNSPELEKKMIKGQNTSLGALCRKKAGTVQIAHVNTPTNGFYFWGKRLGKLNPFWGEKASRHQNVEGMAQYAVWLGEDLEGVIDEGKIKEFKQKINAKNALCEKLQELQEQKHRKGVTKKEKVRLGKEIKELRNEIDKIRKELFDPSKKTGLLFDFYKVVKNTRIEEASKKETANLYTKLLGNQLGIKEDRMDRGQELMMFQLLNERLGVISAINCKSGLDRTGFAFSMTMGLSQVPQDQKLSLVQNWDRCSAALNKKMREFGNDMEKLHNWLNQEPPHNDKDIYEQILKFRLDVLDNILKVGMPITAISSGLVGLKWGSGINENLVPLNFFPPVIKLGEETVSVMTYDKKGQVNGLTEIGHRLFTQVTARRGG